MFYKVVKGLVPAIDPTDYLQEIRNKRQVKANNFSDFQYTNIVERQETRNSRSYIDSLQNRHPNELFFPKNNSAVEPSGRGYCMPKDS